MIYVRSMVLAALVLASACGGEKDGADVAVQDDNQGSAVKAELQHAVNTHVRNLLNRDMSAALKTAAGAEKRVSAVALGLSDASVKASFEKERSTLVRSIPGIEDFGDGFVVTSVEMFGPDEAAVTLEFKGAALSKPILLTREDGVFRVGRGKTVSAQRQIISDRATYRVKNNWHETETIRCLPVNGNSFKTVNPGGTVYPYCKQFRCEGGSFWTPEPDGTEFHVRDDWGNYPHSSVGICEHNSWGEDAFIGSFNGQPKVYCTNMCNEIY